MFDYNATPKTSSDATLASTNTVQTSIYGRPSVILGSLFPQLVNGYKPCCCL